MADSEINLTYTSDSIVGMADSIVGMADSIVGMTNH
jgi:hypothetical protein